MAKGNPFVKRKKKRGNRSVAMKISWINRKQNIQCVQQGEGMKLHEVDVNAAFHDYCSVCPETPFPGYLEMNPEVHHEEVIDHWDPQNEYDSITTYTLESESTKVENVIKFTGNRVVDIQYILNETLKVQYKHSQKCTFGKLTLHEEKKHGLFSSFTLKCEFCENCFVVHSEKPSQKNISTVNHLFVWGTITSGSTYKQCTDILTTLNIPTISYSYFHQIEENIADCWKDVLEIVMEEAGKEEYDLAVEHNQISPDGTPWIHVHCDGAWSKRSYGHSYNALSGTAVVIGKRTGKVLFVGIRNKYCCICARANNLKNQPKAHRCFKNWDASSTSMEADIIVEAFNCSIEMHRLKYLKIIADGDSSVFYKIRQQVSYGSEIEKIECVNHIIKNYGKVLHKIKANISIPVEARKALSQEKIKKLQDFVMFAAKINEEADELKADMENSIYHIYGDHLSCNDRYCNIVGYLDTNLKSKLMDTELLLHLKGALETILPKAHKMIAYENNNRAENFMSLLAKYNCGKRINFIQRRGFQTRTVLTALQYNTGLSWQLIAFKYMKLEIGDILRKKIQEHENNKIIRKRGKKRKRAQDRSDRDYGPWAVAAPLNEEEYNSEYKRIISSLQLIMMKGSELKIRFWVTKTEQSDIAASTVGQFSNMLYISEREKRLTASNFGIIIKRKLNNSCTPLLKRLLYAKNITTPAIQYGKRCEDKAKSKLEAVLKQRIQNAGLFIDTEHGYLAASPDGLIGDDAIVEIKCSYSMHTKRRTIEEEIELNKQFYLKYNSNGKPSLKRNHNYFFQIQGQLNITKRKLCYFVVFIDETQPLFIEQICRDEELWRTFMVPKLRQFFMGCFLPERIQQFIKHEITCTHVAVIDSYK